MNEERRSGKPNYFLLSLGNYDQGSYKISFYCRQSNQMIKLENIIARIKPTRRTANKIQNQHKLSVQV